ncbi:TolC family protein [Bacteroidales bacterium OttesenSCG-928-J19]|nr:TolC family protein [Bacteroidales bacterium OttesenSCG-928-J19]
MKKTLYIALGLLLLASQTGFAQKLWTLEECINHAIEHNISVKQMEIQKQDAEVSLHTAKMSRLPDLNAGAGQGWGFGRTAVESDYRNTTQASTSFSLSTSMPIFTGFRISNEIERNKIALDASLLSLEKAKEDIALAVAYAFLDVLFKKELVILAEEQFSLSQDQVKKTKALIDAGSAPRSQLYEIEAQLAKDEVSLIQAKLDLNMSRLELAQNLELERETEFDIQVPPLNNLIEGSMKSILPTDVVYDNALAIKPTIKIQELNIESAEKTLNIAKSAYYPTLSLSAGISTNFYYVYNEQSVTREVTVPGSNTTYHYVYNTLHNDSFADQFKNRMSENIRLSLNIPIFNRFSTRNNVKSAKLNILNQEFILENTKKALYKEIQTAYQSAVGAQEKFISAEKAVKATEESFRYAQERYEVGKSTVYEFNESKLNLIRTKSEQIQAKYDYIFRAKILDYYNGVPIKL